MQIDGASHRHTNHLIHEQSPYLLQHAHNPVDWYPWCKEALRRAREENKPIFLSIGYSTCHWCHVMERESFENEAIAALMNEYFICIKVDREERPDLDEIYMAAVQGMTGQGGWPMSVFLTPQLKPFFGGTYFPPEDRFGRPGFKSVLLQIHELWGQEHARILSAAEQISNRLGQLELVESAAGELDAMPVQTLYEQISTSFDPENGGWGGAPKFPRGDYGSLCLRWFRKSGDKHALTMALSTLEHMADGGIYDQLGGGFARYSTDPSWLVPHFEKMLYDNAQLVFHYLEAYQLTGEERYAEIAGGTLDYVLREMTDPRGGFYSAEDADSEGEEGKFYVWDAAEVERVLPSKLLAPFRLAYGLSEQGNWEGSNILHRAMGDPEVAAALKLPVLAVREALEKARQVLLSLRAKRTRPALDDKVLAAWNGLMIQTMARASVVLKEPRYLGAAEKAADFILNDMMAEGKLQRRWREGRAGIDAYAEDYAMLVGGLLELYECSFQPRFFAAAVNLHRTMMKEFADEKDGALFNTRAGESELLVRVKVGYDGATPTANSVAASNMLSLYELTGEDEYARQLEQILHAFWGALSTRPATMTRMVLVLDAYLGDRTELVLAGRLKEVLPLLQEARASYNPDLFISHASPDRNSEDLLPALAGRVSLDGATAYVCRAFSCQQPTRDPATMLKELGGTRYSP